ncbi:MAG: bifunctional aspartate transaminase/aspartate 4-decarboxylase [Pseudomonadota bacterium]
MNDDKELRAAEKEYETLSPFELKNKLIELAEAHHEHLMLNAGRGNPNWLADIPRHAFSQLQLFALAEAKRVMDQPGFAGSPVRAGVGDRFNHFLETHAEVEGVAFLKESVAWCGDNLGIAHDDLVFELVDGILGDHYPSPDRMLSVSEQIVRAFLELEMCKGAPPPGKFDLFATEGGTAAMSYIFNSLMENKLLHKGDKIALGTPIFTPYLEIPALNDYQFVELEVQQSEDDAWQYPDAELDKLRDPSVKAFFLVNPANPSSVAMHPDSLARIASIVAEERPDLILLTDDVYGTFVNEFESLASICPRNTILVYSFSKYFGATGWRLGVIAIHPDNVFDQQIAALECADKEALRARYATVVLEPEKMKLIDRLVADSRAVALNHTAGLSTPQQIMMVLFSLAGLLDKAHNSEYKKAARAIVRERFETLFAALGEPCPEDEFSAFYYVDIDIPRLAQSRYGDDFAAHLFNDHEPIDFVWRLATEKSVVLMDGGGFDAPKMSVRVSLANLNNDAYAVIGKAISDLLQEYYTRWNQP